MGISCLRNHLFVIIIILSLTLLGFLWLSGTSSVYAQQACWITVSADQVDKPGSGCVQEPRCQGGWRCPGTFNEGSGTTSFTTSPSSPSTQTCTLNGKSGICGNAQSQTPGGGTISCGGTLEQGGSTSCTNPNYSICYVCSQKQVILILDSNDGQFASEYIK